MILLLVKGLSGRLEIDIPNCAYRDLELVEGQAVQVSLKKKSIWTIPNKAAVFAHTSDNAQKPLTGKSFMN